MDVSAPAPSAASPRRPSDDAPLAPAGRTGADGLARLASLVALADGGPREWIDVHAPFTGALLGRVPRATPADVVAAVRRAREAQREWAARRVADRVRVLRRFHDAVLDRQDEILDLIQLENGKARLHAFEEVVDVAIVARHYARVAPRLLRPRRRVTAFPGVTRAWELRHPVGVVGFIVPWNYPLNLAVTDALPALVAGNAAVLKPDHQTSFTALWAAERLYEAGLPREVFPVVTGEGPSLGPTLVDAVDFVMFTGSTRTGRVIAAQAAPRLVGYSLELGGKNPMLVLDDADVDRAAEGAVRGSFVGAGQVCVSIERLYVDAAVHDAFVERFVERTRALRLSPALDYTADVGSLTSARQLETVERHVADALAKGARLLAGGRRRPDLGPWFYEPTILTDVTPDMLLHDEETFGPVVAVYRVRGEDEAVARANATRYGLSASVWTRDVPRGLRVAARLEAGSVNVNEAYAAAWASVGSPIGGFKESGHGRRHGDEGLLKYTESQTVAAQRWMPLAPLPSLRGQRYAKAITRLLRVLARVR